MLIVVCFLICLPICLPANTCGTFPPLGGSLLLATQLQLLILYLFYVVCLFTCFIYLFVYLFYLIVSALNFLLVYLLVLFTYFVYLFC